MFKKIIGQSNIVSLLSTAVQNKTLAQSLLFCGPRYSGKLSIALELARVLTCEKQKAEHCDCATCQMQRDLLYPYTLLLGNHAFMQEISACYDVLLATPCRETFLLFCLAVRRLLRRFDSFLWDEQDAHYRKAKPLLSGLAEQLAELTFADDPTWSTQNAKELTRLKDKSLKLAAILKGYSVTIGQVRALRHWCTTTSWQKKIVILEWLDRMNEGACNSLLKILEEPPEGLYFIMIAESKTMVMPTLLSRLRTYLFLPRTPQEEHRLLQQVFYQKEPLPRNLSHFLSNFSSTGPQMQDAQRFYAGLQNASHFTDVYPAEIAEENFEEFLSQLACEIKAQWSKGTVSTLIACQQLKQLGELKRQFILYRQNPQSLAESFFFTYFCQKN